MRFADRVVIVTGGASGIGRATVLRCASETAAVVIADVDAARCNTVSAEALASGARDALACTCNVAHQDDVARCVNTTLERFGRLDAVVNNAGVMVFKPLVEQTHEDWARILGVDLLGAFYFIREAFGAMTDGGAIVNVSSIHAVETTPLVSSYAAAKAALISLTRSAAIEGKARGIRVNAVLPGAIDTPMLWQNPNIKSGLEQIQQHDVGRPEDVAAAIAFLASDDARFVQGTEFRVDGGRLSRL